MEKTISTYRLRQYIGKKKSLTELNINPTKKEACLNVKNNFRDYIEPFLTVQLETKDFQEEKRPQVILISAAGATGKSTMCKHLSSELNIPVFDLGIAREVASNSLTGALVKEFGSSFGSFQTAITTGEQSIIIDALDEGIAISGSNAINAFIDDVLTYANCKSNNSVPVIMFGRNQAVSFITDYLKSCNVDFLWLQISAFTLDQAGSYVDMKVKPADKFLSSYKELTEYIFDTIGSFVNQQSKVSDTFLGYAPVLDAISTAIKQKNNYMALLEEYKKNNASGILFILKVIDEIIRREKEDKINAFINEIKNDLSDKEYRKAISTTYNDINQCEALMQIIQNEDYPIKISSEEQINSKFTERMRSFIEDHPFLNGKRFENAVFESYVIARLMIEDPENIYLQTYLEDIYRDAYMLFYFLVELAKDKELDWHYISYAYRSLNSFDNRNDYGQTAIMQVGSSTEHEIKMMRNKDNKELSCYSILDENVELKPGGIVSNLTIDSDRIDLTLDSKSTEIIPPLICICRNIKVSGDVFLNAPQDESDGKGNDNRVVFECDRIDADFSNGHRPSITKNNANILLSISATKKTVPPFSEYCCDLKLPDEMSDEFKNAFVKLRKILITFRSHSKGSMARYKGKVDDARISGHTIGKALIDKLLSEHIIYEKGCMYMLDRDCTALKLGLTFDKLQATYPTPQMIIFINTVLTENKNNKH